MKKLLKTIREFFARLFGKKKVELSLVPKEPVIPTLTETINIGQRPSTIPSRNATSEAPKDFSTFWKENGSEFKRKEVSIKKVSVLANEASGKIASLEQIVEACKEKNISRRRVNMKEIAKVAWETKP